MNETAINGWTWLFRWGALFGPSNGDPTGGRRVRAGVRDVAAETGDAPVDPVVVRLKADDESALLGLLRDHGAELETVAFVTTRDDEFARDVVQDVCFDLWQRRASLEIRGPLLPYLRRAVHHRAVTVVRRERTQRRTEDALRASLVAHPRTDVNLGPSALEAEALSLVVAQGLASLPPRCREIFLLHREAELTYPQIAELLGVSLPTVYNQISRALKRLAELLRPDL